MSLQDTVSLPAQVANDTIGALLRRAQAESVYIEMLEKTNQQLSLWINPYGIMVGALAVLFTVLAIVAAFAIWRQGEGYRAMIDDQISEYRVIVDSLVAERLGAMQDQLDEAIDEAKGQLEGATGDKERKLLEQRIERLEARKESLPKQTTMGQLLIEAAGIPPSTSDAEKSRLRNKIVNQWCQNCEHTWWDPPAGLLGSERLTVVCPQCGTEQRK